MRHPLKKTVQQKAPSHQRRLDCRHLTISFGIDGKKNFVCRKLLVDWNKFRQQQI
jgi:hypothetical protein